MSKFVDLKYPIIQGIPGNYGDRPYLEDVLAWFDEHPHKVPETPKTITHNEDERLADEYHRGLYTWAHFRQALGVEVADPEPTTAERLADDIADGLTHNKSVMSPHEGKIPSELKYESEQLAEYLTEHGWVKTPEEKP